MISATAAYSSIQRIATTIALCGVLFMSTKTLMAQETLSAERLYVENKGQIGDQHGKPNKDVRYLIVRPGLNIQLRDNGFSYDSYVVDRCGLSADSAERTLPSKFPDRPNAENTYHFHRVDIDLVGAHPKPTITATGASQDYLNYYTHITEQSNGEQGATGVRGFERVTYHDVWPSIDIEWFLNEAGNPEYQFIVRPGGDLALIRWRYRGAYSTDLVADAVVMHVQHGPIRERIPRSFFSHTKQPLDVRYKALGRDTYGFDASRNDLTMSSNDAFIIDPTPERLWATYYGGDTTDEARWVEVSGSNNVFVGGRSASIAGVASTGSYQNTRAGAFDAYIAKFTASGTRVWGTYLGGEFNDKVNSGALLSGGGLYVGGETASTSGIATSGTQQTIINGVFDGFLIKLLENGSRSWGTYIGNSSNDVLTGVDDFPNGEVAVGGYTFSYGGNESIGCGNSNGTAFLLRYSANGLKLWNMCIGSNAFAQDIAVLDSHDVVMVGEVSSGFLGATAGAHDVSYNGGQADAFIARVGTNGASGGIRWNTYFGGTGSYGPDQATSVAVTAAGDIVVAGNTGSLNGIATTGAYETAPLPGTGSCGFLAKFSSSGSQLFGTYVSGAGSRLFVDVTPTNNIIVASLTSRDSYVATSDAYQSVRGGSDDAFLAKYSAFGQKEWGTYYGGTGADWANYVAVNSNEDVFLVGWTGSTSSISTPGSHQPSYGGGVQSGTTGGDGFLAVFRTKPPCIPPSIVLIASPDACQGELDTFRVRGITGTEVRWNAPKLGAIITGALSDTTITIRWTSSGRDTLRVRVVQSADTTCYKDTSVVVTINALPTPVISGATSVCDDSRHVYRLPTSIGRTYAWQTSVSGSVQGSSAADSIVVSWRRVGSGPDTLRVRETVVASGCSKDTLLVVQVQPRPTPIITGPSTICDGGTAVYSTPQIAGRAYAWRVSSRGSIQGSSTSDNISAQWSNAGSGLDTVFLRETNVATGCAKDTLIVVRVNALPQHVITGTASTCTGKIESYSVSNASSSNLRWTLPSSATLVSGTTTSSAITLRWEAAGTFDLKVQATAVSTGCTKDTVLRVSVGQSPNVGVTGAASVCLSDGKGKVYSVAQGVSGTQYVWTVTPASRGSIVSGASTNQVTIDWLQRGTANLRVSITDPSTCVRDSTVTITIEDSLRPAITSASGFAMCQGDSLRIDAGSGYSSYTWYEGATVVGTTRYYTTTKAARYVVQVSNGGCSGSSTAITTTVNALPTATVSENPAGILLATTNAGQAQYQWYSAASTPWTPLTGATQATYAPATSGTYGVDVTNTTTGCVRRSTAYTITIGPPPADPVVTAVQSAITVCRGYTANARVVITGGKPPYRITWTIAGTGTVLNRDVDYILVPMTTDGVLRCSVMDANDRSDSADIAVTVVPVPTVQISQAAPDRLLANCDNPAATYQWYTIDGTGWRVIAGATQQSYSPANDGQFGVEASTECTVRSSSFTFIAPPPQTLVVNDYDFGSLPVDDLINASGGHVGSVQVYNRTGSYLELTGASTDDTSTFVVPQQWPRRMNDGDTAEIAVRFMPTAIKTYTAKLNVTSNTTYSGAGTITGTGRDLLPDERVTQVVLRPTRSEVEPGDTISVMLMVSVERPVQTAGAAGRYLSTIQWDYRVLEPLSTPGMGYDTSGTYAVANVSNGFRQQNQVQLYRFRFRAKQAEVDSTSIIFSGAKGFVWQDDRKAYPALVDSVVRVRVCRDGGPQLVGRVLPARIVRATPTPARDAVDVELNLTGTSASTGTIDIVTADGRRVKTHNVNQHTKNLRIDLTDLSAGIYTIMLTTSTGADHVSMVVVP